MRFVQQSGGETHGYIGAKMSLLVRGRIHISLGYWARMVRGIHNLIPQGKKGLKLRHSWSAGVATATKSARAQRPVIFQKFLYFPQPSMG